MKTVTQLLREHLLSEVFLDPLPTPVTIGYIQRCQVTVERFEMLRRNRMVFGWYRHRHNLLDPGRGGFKAVESAIYRLQDYLETGNQENLVDAANLCAIEFVLPGSHPAPHFTHVDDGHHAERID